MAPTAARHPGRPNRAAGGEEGNEAPQGQQQRRQAVGQIQRAPSPKGAGALFLYRLPWVPSSPVIRIGPRPPPRPDGPGAGPGWTGRSEGPCPRAGRCEAGHPAPLVRHDEAPRRAGLRLRPADLMGHCPAPDRAVGPARHPVQRPFHLRRRAKVVEGQHRQRTAGDQLLPDHQLVPPGRGLPVDGAESHPPPGRAAARSPRRRPGCPAGRRARALQSPSGRWMGPGPSHSWTHQGGRRRRRPDRQGEKPQAVRHPQPVQPPHQAPHRAVPMPHSWRSPRRGL